jgi:hypothetical protein
MIIIILFHLLGIVGWSLLSGGSTHMSQKKQRLFLLAMSRLMHDLRPRPKKKRKEKKKKKGMQFSSLRQRDRDRKSVFERELRAKQ